MRRLMILKKEHGYTFIESLFQLIIFTVFVQFLLLFFLWKKPIEQQYLNMSGTDWELFAVDMQHLLSHVQQLDVYPAGNGFTLINPQGVIDIEQGNGVIRKKVYGLGHVPLLTNVQSTHFTLEEATLFIRVTLQGGDQKERGFTVGIYSE